MKKGQDIIVELPGVVIIHQKLPGNEVGRHEHSEHEFFLPLQGEITVQYDGKTASAGPGRMLYVPPDLDHSFNSSAHGSGERVIWLIKKPLWNLHIKAKFLPQSMPANSLAKEILFYLLIHRKKEGTKYFVAALVEALGEALSAHQLEGQDLFSDHISGKLSDERIRRSCSLIENNLAGLSLPQIAKQSGLSPRNFNRLFLQQTGLGPKDFLLLRRVEKAKHLLRSTKLTVTDISLEVGYNSLSKFIGTFKRFAGVLPSDFRNEHRS